MRLSVLAICCAAALAGGPAHAGPVDEVVAAERAFAADGQARGWIAAFKRYAAPDAVVFRGDPVNAQDSLKDQPDEPADRSLKWWPIWAGIAQSGDLGFTTGPFTAGETGFGHYFTVWAKQPDGSWRWIFDGGPRNEAKSPFGPDTTPVHMPVATNSSGSANKAWAEVAAIEAALAKAALSDAKAAVLAHLADDARIMGSPAQPAVDRSQHHAELDRRNATMELKPLGGRASRAGDLVFTYGAAAWTRDGAPRRGHTVRIWQKRASGWVLVFDELLAAPPKPTAP